MRVQPAERRRQRARTDARRTILDATEQLLLEQGFEGFSMRKLVARCGYAAPTIYHYFGDKTGLFDQLLEEHFRRLVATLRRVARHDDPLDDLRAMALAFGRFGLRTPTHYALLTTPRDDGSEPLPAAEEAQALFDDPIDALAKAGRLRVDDPEVVHQCLWAVLHGVITLQSSRPSFEWSKDLLATALDVALRGLIDGDVCASARPPTNSRPRRKRGAASRTTEKKS